MEDGHFRCWSMCCHITNTIFFKEVFGIFSFLRYLALPPLRFLCVGGCWDRTRGCGEFGIDSQRALTIRLDLIHKHNCSIVQVYGRWLRYYSYLSCYAKLRDHITFYLYKRLKIVLFVNFSRLGFKAIFRIWPLYTKKVVWKRGGRYW